MKQSDTHTVADPFTHIKPSTAGERLFQRLGSLGLKDLAPNRLGQQRFVRLTGRGAPFGAYLEVAMIAFAFKRVMKASHGIFRDKSQDRADGNRRLTVVLRDWFDWLDKEDLGVLVRDTLRAEDASEMPIPKGLETEIWRSRRVHTCCFCGDQLTTDTHGMVRDPRGRKATLEHVWPASLGGDSIVDNLVPACHGCNQHKGDLFTWEQGSIHDFIYPIDFHLSDFLPRLPVTQRILLQRRAVITLAQRERMTLKHAVLRVGPYGEMSAVDASDTWDLFNTQNHVDSLGERLW